MIELLQGVSPSEDGRSDERRQERTREEPREAPSEAGMGPAPSEERPAQKRGWGYSEEDCGEAPKARPAEQVESAKQVESTEK
jgi:hypothetical protein